MITDRLPQPGWRLQCSGLHDVARCRQAVIISVLAYLFVHDSPPPIISFKDILGLRTLTKLAAYLLNDAAFSYITLDDRPGRTHMRLSHFERNFGNLLGHLQRVEIFVGSRTVVHEGGTSIPSRAATESVVRALQKLALILSVCHVRITGVSFDPAAVQDVTAEVIKMRKVLPYEVNILDFRNLGDTVLLCHPRTVALGIQYSTYRIMYCPASASFNAKSLTFLHLVRVVFDPENYALLREMSLIEHLNLYDSLILETSAPQLAWGATHILWSDLWERCHTWPCLSVLNTGQLGYAMQVDDRMTVSRVDDLDVPFDRAVRDLCALNYLRDLVNARTQLTVQEYGEGLESAAKAKPLKTGLWLRLGSK
jgi:hypothetical protein